MKKAYYTPKAEKLEFDYTQAVVASNKGFGCMPQVLRYWDGQSAGSSFCREVVQHYNGDM